MDIAFVKYNIVTSQMNELWRKIEIIENLLSDDYIIPVDFLNIPDDAPESIPRIIAKRKDEKGQLIISKNTIQFESSENEVIDCDSSDYMVFKSKLENEMNRTYKLAQTMEYEIKFSGLLVDVQGSDIADGDLIKSQLSRLINFDANNSLQDLNLKTTYLYEDEFYCNITIKNRRAYEESNTNGIQPLRLLKPIYHKIFISIDINDRYGYNYNINHKASLENVNRILNITDKLLCNGLDKILEKNEVMIDG